jgi:hypothetical protein
VQNNLKFYMAMRTYTYILWGKWCLYVAVTNMPVCTASVENCIIRGTIICTLHQILLGWSNHGRWDWLDRQHAWESKDKVVPVPQLSTTPWRRIGEWMYNSFFDLSTRWRWVVNFTSRPLYPQGKSPWYPLNRRLGGPQSRSGSVDEEKNSQPQSWIEP